MSDSPLPVAILNAHGSLAIPPELYGRIALTPEQIFNESDAFADHLFDFGERVVTYLRFPYARAIIDVNRPDKKSLHHRPGDGVVKWQTSYGTKVYQTGMEPDETLEAQLLATYFQPWHEQLTQIARNPAIKLVLDCHTMAAVGPQTYDDPFKLRPRVMVGNLGDYNGAYHEKRGHVSATGQLTRGFAQAWGEQVEAIEPLVGSGEITAVNNPFFGGWNLLGHPERVQPWLTLEYSRAMYVGHQTGESPIPPMNKTRVSQLREALFRTISLMLERMETADFLSDPARN